MLGAQSAQGEKVTLASNYKKVVEEIDDKNKHMNPLVQAIKASFQFCTGPYNSFGHLLRF